MVDFSDPQVQAIYNQILGGQFAPQDASALAAQLEAPTTDIMVGGRPDPGSKFLTQGQYGALTPFIGSMEFSGADPTVGFTGGEAFNPAANYQSGDVAGQDLQYLLSHGYASGQQPDHMGIMNVFDNPYIDAGAAIITMGATGAFSGVGGAADAAAGAGEGAAAGGTFGEAGTSLAGGEAASGSATGVLGDAAATGALQGVFDANGVSVLPETTVTSSVPSASMGSNVGLPNVAGASAVGAGAGAGGAAGAADPTGSGAIPQQQDVGGTVGTSKTVAQGVNPSTAGASNPVGQFVDPATDIASTANLATPSAPDLATVNDASALQAENTGVFNPAATPVQQAAPFAPVSGGGAGGGANAMTSDALQQELTANGINATGSNAAQVSEAQGALGSANSVAQPSWLDRLGMGGVGSFLKANANWAVPLTMGGISALRGATSGAPAASSNVGQVAGQERAAGGQLLSGGVSGNLTPGAQASVQQFLTQSIADIKSKYAAMGQSGSTAEAQDIAAAQAKASAMTNDFANQMINQGSNLLNLAQSGYGDLARIQALSDADLQNAIAEFGAAAGMGAIKGLTSNG